MYCHKCGKPLFQNAEYCSYCGTKTPVCSEQAQEDSQSNNVEEHDTSLDLEEIHTIDAVKLSDLDEKNNDDDNDEKPTTFLSKAIYVIVTLISLIFIKVIVRSIVHDKNTLQVLSYAVPGFISGIVIGIVAYIILIKCSDIDNKIWHIAVILGVSGVMGLIGGIPFAIGGSIVSSVVVFIISKKLKGL